MLKKDTENKICENLRILVESVGRHDRFQLHTAFNGIVAGGWAIDNRRNTDLHLLYVRSGEGMYWLEGQEAPLEPGVVIFVSNGSLHRARPTPENPPHILPLRFGVHLLATGEERAACARPFTLRHTAHTPGWFEEHFLRLHTLVGDTQEIAMQEMHARLLLVLTRLYTELSQEGGAFDVRIERVRQAIEQHPAARWDVDELARQAGLSTKYFRRRFRTQVGLTPRQYQIRVRCARARYLLEETDLPVGEIARQLEYADLYTFSRQFSQVMGMSPTHLRRGG